MIAASTRYEMKTYYCHLSLSPIFLSSAAVPVTRPFKYDQYARLSTLQQCDSSPRQLIARVGLDKRQSRHQPPWHFGLPDKSKTPRVNKTKHSACNTRCSRQCSSSFLQPQKRLPHTINNVCLSPKNGPPALATSPPHAHSQTRFPPFLPPRRSETVPPR